MKFISSKENIKDAKILLTGIPFDATSSFRAGSRFAPDEIRKFSDSIEDYSPYFNKSLNNINFVDIGNIFITINNFSKLSKHVKEELTPYINNKKILSIGGEHLITLPLIELFYSAYPDLIVIQLDAHADLRDTYFDEKYSHATVMRRISEIVGGDNIFQLGIRSGTEDEFIFGKENTNFFPFSINVKEIVNKIKGKKIYLTIDLDVLDPSILPGTGNPEPGGHTFNELIDTLKNLSSLDIIGADVVELSPDNDNSGVSSIVAAKIIRELLIILDN